MYILLNITEKGKKIFGFEKTMAGYEIDLIQTQSFENIIATIVITLFISIQTDIGI